MPALTSNLIIAYLCSALLLLLFAIYKAFALYLSAGDLSDVMGMGGTTASPTLDPNIPLRANRGPVGRIRSAMGT
jgi:hypothetical protein